MQKKRIFGLDLLRALAILIVVYGHGYIVAPDLVITYFPSFPLPEGVDLFFVLSGFLIGNILIKLLKNNQFSKFKEVRSFWSRRWFRTLPLYYFILFVNSVLSYTEIIPSNFNYFNLSFFVFCQNLYTGFVGFFYESWSLSIEEWFYLLIPLLILLFQKFLPSKKAILLSILIMIFAPIIYRSMLFNPTLDSFWYSVNFKKVVLTRLDAIGFGLLAAYFFNYNKLIWNKYKKLFLIVGILLIAYATFFKPFHQSFYAQAFFLSLLPFGTMFLLPFLNSIHQIGENWFSKFITFISKISYSMYLVNLSIVGLMIAKYSPEINLQIGIINYILFWILTISLSILTYYFIEKPFLKMRDKKKSTKKA
ncbi:MAG: acyltransferase family protein, partial [Lishizhenia sp.]